MRGGVLAPGGEGGGFSLPGQGATSRHEGCRQGDQRSHGAQFGDLTTTDTLHHITKMAREAGTTLGALLYWCVDGGWWTRAQDRHVLVSRSGPPLNNIASKNCKLLHCSTCVLALLHVRLGGVVLCLCLGWGLPGRV